MPIRRLAYRAAYLGLRVYWLVRRPEVTGVKCMITDGDRVLLVRHTYGSRRWDMPGGSVKRGEEPVDAARREMHEELGVSIEDWRPLGVISLSVDHRRDRLHCFRAEVDDPEIEINLGELSAAEWFSLGALPRKVGRYTRPILARAANG